MPPGIQGCIQRQSRSKCAGLARAVKRTLGPVGGAEGPCLEAPPALCEPRGWDHHRVWNFPEGILGGASSITILSNQTPVPDSVRRRDRPRPGGQCAIYFGSPAEFSSVLLLRADDLRRLCPRITSD